MMSSGVIPTRGAFSAHLKLPGSAASGSQRSKSSAPPSVLSLASPHSRYELSPGQQHLHQQPSSHSRHSTFDQRVTASPRSPPPPAPPPSKLRPPRVASLSVAQQIRKSSTVPVQQPDAEPSRNKAPQRDNNVDINSDDESQARAALVPLPSVHPIDTLAKKLRQQALELTVVYEQLEKKSQALQDQEKQIQELKFQLESLRCTKQTSTTSPILTKRLSSSATRQSTISAKIVYGGASKKVEDLQRQVQELQQERTEHQVSTKRIEKALEDLKLHQESRMEGHQPLSSVGAEFAGIEGQFSSELLVQEQQLYIRVLEEAVHLKASELHVTGHEELLMVLAELRHTIYHQEQDVADKQRQVESLQVQLHDQNEKQLTQSQQLDEKSTTRELEIYELRQAKSTLTSQLDQLQRQLQRESEQSRRLERSLKEVSEREAHLREQLTSAVQLKTLTESKVDKLKVLSEETSVKLEQMTGNFDHEAREARRLSKDLADTQARLEELKALQDDLLCKLDSYAMTAEAATLDKHALQVQLADELAKEQSKVTQLKSLVAAKDDETRGLTERLEGLELRLRETAAELETVMIEKVILGKQVEDERLEMERASHDQSLALQEKIEAVDASERRWSSMLDGLRQLDAALRASREIFTTAEPSANHSDSDELDNEAAADLQGFKVCMRALDDLTTSNSVCDSHLTEHLPSLRELLDSAHNVMTISTNYFEQLLGSWARERLDLRKATDELQQTTQLCETAMRKAHQEQLRTCEQLEEVSNKLDAEKREVSVLKLLDEELNRDIEAQRMLKRQVVEQNRVIATFERHVGELNAQLQAAESAETQLNSALAGKIQTTKELYKELREVTERVKDLEVVERALKRAVELSEHQNTWNEELALKLHEVERLLCDREESFEALKTREITIAERFRALFRRYCEQLRASSVACSARSKLLAYRDVDLVERLGLYEDEEARGDVVRLVQLFPMLLEDFVSSSTSVATYDGCEYDGTTKPQKLEGEPASCEPNKQAMDTRQALRFADEKLSTSSIVTMRPERPSAPPRSSPHVSAREEHNAGIRLHSYRSSALRLQPPAQAAQKKKHIAHAAQSSSVEDASFREQLELIRDAFQTFQQPRAATHNTM